MIFSTEMKSKKLILLIFLLSVIIGIVLFLIFENNKKTARICFKDNCFEVELALTSKQKEKGLMFRKDLSRDKGMLFVYNNEIISSFWMKNVNFPLDIIWISENKEVVFISKNTLPCLTENCPSIKPTEKAKYVLEIKGGISEEIGLKVGDKLEIIWK